MHVTPRFRLLLSGFFLTFALSSVLHAQHGLGGGERKWIKIEWATTETENFSIDYEKLIATKTVKRIGKELEDALEQYIKVFKVKPRKGQKLKIRFLDNFNTFEQVGGDPSHPGFFRPSDKYLVLLNRPFYQLVPTTYHEAFHQYLDMYVGGDVSVPTWFNEGMATYFEGMQRNKGNKQLNADNIDNRKLRMVKEAIETRDSIPLAKLVDATHKEFHAKDRESLYYTQSFALIYYVMKVLKPAAAVKFMHTLRKSKDVEKANARLFGTGRKKLPRIQKHWKSYILKVKIGDKKG